MSAQTTSLRARAIGSARATRPINRFPRTMQLRKQVTFMSNTEVELNIQLKLIAEMSMPIVVAAITSLQTAHEEYLVYGAY